MNNLLVIHSSPFDTSSTSRLIANELVEKMRINNSLLEEKSCDLHAESPPHWGKNEILAAMIPAQQRTHEQRKALLLSDHYCAQILWANQIIISAPMWNFSVPSTLKAWIDHIVRAGVTFQYQEQGPKGLVNQLKKVFIIESAGGFYTDKNAHLNHTGPYLESVFKFIGAKEVQIISVHGTAMNCESAKNQAQKELENIFK